MSQGNQPGVDRPAQATARRGIPFGWFQVGYPEDFEARTVAPLEYFDRQLVAWRDPGGELHVADAYCPHLGAHLGYGGSPVGDRIRCPFHGWEFGPNGNCDRVPYSSHVARAGMRIHPVREVGGLSLVWFHADKAVSPAWEVPIPGFKAHHKYVRHRRIVKTRWEDTGENVVDVAHFPSLHGTGHVSSCQVAEDGFHRRVEMRMAFRLDGEDFDGSVTTDHYGPGLFIVRLDAKIRLTFMSAVTPIDNERVDIRYSFVVPPKAADRRRHLLSRLLIREIVRQIDQDSAIWQHKIYKDLPRLVPGDGPIVQWRRWAAQFHCNGMPDAVHTPRS